MTQMIAAIYEQGVFKPLQPVRLIEGQHGTLSVEETVKGSPAAILRVMRQLPDLTPEDVDELERVIAEGELQIYTLIRKGRIIMKYTVLLRRGNESGYVATVPTLPGCVSQGQTKREALKNVKEAMEVYIETLREDGLPVPTEVGKELVEVEVLAR